MESLVTWFTSTLGAHISREAIVFIISLFPILELRGGLLAASLLKIPAATAIPICIIGNIIPIPFILLFIRQIFKLMKKKLLLLGLVGLTISSTIVSCAKDDDDFGFEQPRCLYIRLY
mgnify:CR=1 FL=1